MIIQSDARTITREFCAQFDVLCCDPPYSRHVHKSATSQSKTRGARKRDMGFDHLDPALRRAVGLAAASVKRWSVVYSDVESSTWLRISAAAQGAQYIRTVPWVRWSMPQLSGDRPAQGFEHVLVFWGTDGGKKSWNGSGALVALEHEAPSEFQNVINEALTGWGLAEEGDASEGTCNPRIFELQEKYVYGGVGGDPVALNHLALRGEEKHKAEKPLDQCLDLVSWFSNPGEKVLDLFSGSAAIHRACDLLDRQCLAFEIDERWLVSGNARIKAPLSKGERERAQRWLDAGSGQVAEPEGPAKERAERRAADKALVRAKGLV